MYFLLLQQNKIKISLTTANKLIQLLTSKSERRERAIDEIIKNLIFSISTHTQQQERKKTWKIKKKQQNTAPNFCFKKFELTNQKKILK